VSKGRRYTLAGELVDQLGPLDLGALGALDVGALGRWRFDTWLPMYQTGNARAPRHDPEPIATAHASTIAPNNANGPSPTTATTLHKRNT
jgi:hypothetical protein